MPETRRQARTILLIDDEPFILSATAQMLRNAGHTVHTCEEWGNVMHLVRVESPDLILLDYNMPTLKGDELCGILKRYSVNPGMKIMMFSSESEQFLQGVATSCGADGYIKKDVPREKLLEQIEAALASL